MGGWDALRWGRRSRILSFLAGMLQGSCFLSGFASGWLRRMVGKPVLDGDNSGRLI
jgi:hypothetical protein